MTENKQYSFNVNKNTIEFDGKFKAYVNIVDGQRIVDLLNEQHEVICICENRIAELRNENKQLKSDLKDCRKLKTKRLNKIRNHRAVIEDLGGSIRAYKGKIEQTNEKIDKIKEAMEDTGALTKRQLKEILND